MTSRGIAKSPAQTICAFACRTRITSWCSWESGHHQMHQAFWELALLNLGAHPLYKLSPLVRRKK